MSINEVTMTTVEIAAMTGKRHDHVLRDADRAIEQIGARKSGATESNTGNDPKSGAVESTYLDRKNEARRMLVLNKHMVFTIITGYDTGLRHTVIGRWIELEQIANPAFGSQAITDTLNDLQARVDMMAPAYAEHTRKGTVGRGYLVDEACRMADLPARAVRDWFLSRKVAIKRRVGPVTVNGQEIRIEVNPKFIEQGYAKKGASRSHGGHPDGYKLTLKGLEWLKGHRNAILAWDAERKKVRPVHDADGFVVDITGEGSAAMTVADLPRKARRGEGQQ